MRESLIGRDFADQKINNKRQSRDWWSIAGAGCIAMFIVLDSVLIVWVISTAWDALTK